MSKVMNVTDAVKHIKDGMTLGVCGTGPALEPDLVLQALEDYFQETGSPRNLTLFCSHTPSDRLKEGGYNCFCHKGMVTRVIGSSFNKHRHPKLLEMFKNEELEGYTVGMGTLTRLLGAIATGQPGLLTTVGLGTFMDPRVEGGCMNKRSTNPPVKLVQFEDKEYLFYPSMPIDVAIIRGTTADENGYISFEEEPNRISALDLAAATRASGGFVIAQVKYIARARTLDPQKVRIPGPLVDAVVVHPTQTQVTPGMANPLEGWNPYLVGALKMPLNDVPPIKEVISRTILRRSILELRNGDVINLGVGIPTGLPVIALEEGILDHLIFTNEHGVFGGLMASAFGKSFVTAFNPDALMGAGFQFGFYEGGGLNIALLGIGELDAEGNINVSKFATEWTGPGGFNSITDTTPNLVFCGSLTTGGLEVAVDNGKLRIVKEGQFRKFVPKVEQITLNAKRAHAKGQRVLYVTERAVFQLTSDGLELIEIAPGIDLERDIQANIGFSLRISQNLKLMDARIFTSSLLGVIHGFADNKTR